MPPRRILLLGAGDLTGETCEALTAAGASVERLEDPDVGELREALSAGLRCSGGEAKLAPLPEVRARRARALATVDPNPEVQDGPKWFKVVISLSMLVALLFAAAFTGGLVERLIGRNLTGLLGRRAVPRSDHVIVVGLGQVGLRVCVLLRACGISVVAVDDQPDGENVGPRAPARPSRGDRPGS